jgi:uncharacterized membrane protein/protein-disulfide isomerase
MRSPRNLAILALFAALLGLTFAAYSTYDYAQHLDRQIHAVHCSFIPGAPVSSEADNACKAALFSPYSAIFRESYWGGLPISVFALGAFSFFAGLALYLLLARGRAPRKVYAIFGALAITPFLASLVMFFISLTRLHAFCKVCVGIYFSSTLLLVAGILALRHYARKDDRAIDARGPTEVEVREAGWLVPLALLPVLALATLLPAYVYLGSLPDYKPLLASCGKLAVTSESHNALLKIPTARPVQPVTLFEDPLCPTCKAFHERLVDEGVFERLDVTLVMFPLDSDCNWMIDRSLHPGACELSRAVLCGGNQSRAILEWAYENQEDLREVGKKDRAGLEKRVSDKFGKDVAACAASKATIIKLNQHLHYASNNHIPVSTPQMFLGDKRICDEDTDLGLKYTLAQLAPEVLK